MRDVDQEICATKVYEAVKSGYRLIYTSNLSENEIHVGTGIQRAIDDGICTRKDLFVVSKFQSDSANVDAEDIREAAEKSLQDLNLHYIDAYLLEIIEEVNYLDSWKEIESLVESDLVRNIGLSGTSTDMLCHVLAHAVVKPSLLMLEMHEDDSV